LRFGYVRTHERLPFLRGRLDFTRQMRQPPGSDHRFHVRYERFDVSRPENRLLKTALLRVASRSAQPDLRLRANQAAGVLAEVPVSHAIARDLALWDRGRLLAHYQPVEPWCRLTLQPMVGTRIGTDRADALLWKTEKMFERALENALDRRIAVSASDLALISQGRKDDEGRQGRSAGNSGDAIYLGADEAGRAAFELKPDLMLLQRERVVSVLDAKWKEVDAASEASTAEAGTAVISREDAYQMHAYGHCLLGGSGPLVVVYPAWEGFQAPRTYTLGRSDHGLPLTLTAVPYDLLSDRFLLGPPDSRARQALAPLAPLLETPVERSDGPALTASA
jgi:5-methylcytosine-specific restriction enzyme subunit McrC